MGTSQKTTDGKLKIFGNWPDVDMQVISDYRQYDGMPSKASANCLIRLHMDIEIDEKDVATFADYLANGNGTDLYKAIIAKHTGDEATRGAKALKAALGLQA